MIKCNKMRYLNKLKEEILMLSKNVGQVIKPVTDTKRSFSFGFIISLLAYIIFSVLFFIFAVLRRAYVLSIPLNFDSDVYFAVIIIPAMVAVPWLPVSILNGILSLKLGNKKSLRIIVILITLIVIALSFVFWNLSYN
jgi:hypothetical protein